MSLAIRRHGDTGGTHGRSCLRKRVSTKTPHAEQTSFQSASSSEHTFFITSPLPSRTPTMSLTRSHQLSNPSSRALSGTRSSSSRSVFTLSFHRREATAKSRSAENWCRRGWLVRRGDICWAIFCKYGEGCSERVLRKNADALERPRSAVLYLGQLSSSGSSLWSKDEPREIGPERGIFPWPVLATEFVAFLSGGLYEVGIQPLH